MVKQNDTKTETRQVFIWVCSKCGKQIISLSEKQIAFNKGVHKDTCKGAKKWTFPQMQ